MDEYYIQQTLKLAKKAYKKNEVPVGAIIVKDNKILSTAFNKKNRSNRVIDHAEILAITKANRKLHDWRLNGCTMYVSLKPCDMCMGAIKEARIDKVVYAAETNNVMKNVECIQIDDKKLSIEASKTLKNFFDDRR